jgi:hypothetical protein
MGRVESCSVQYIITLLPPFSFCVLCAECDCLCSTDSFALTGFLGSERSFGYVQFAIRWGYKLWGFFVPRKEFVKKIFFVFICFHSPNLRMDFKMSWYPWSKLAAVGSLLRDYTLAWWRWRTAVALHLSVTGNIKREKLQKETSLYQTIWNQQ